MEARYEEIINHLHKALSSTEEDEQDFKVMSKALAAVFPSTAFFVWARRTRSTTGKQSSRQRGKNKKKRKTLGTIRVCHCLQVRQRLKWVKGVLLPRTDTGRQNAQRETRHSARGTRRRALDIFIESRSLHEGSCPPPSNKSTGGFLTLRWSCPIPAHNFASPEQYCCLPGI